MSIKKQTAPSQEETRMKLEIMYLNEYKQWVKNTDDYRENLDEQDIKKKICEICDKVLLNNGSKTKAPDVKAITEGLKDYEADRHAKFMIEMLNQFSTMTFKQEFILPFRESLIHKSMLAEDSKFGIYSAMFAPARSKATYAMSRDSALIKPVIATLNMGIKGVTPAMDPSGEINKMSFFGLLDEITKRIYGNVENVPIIKCNVPIIDIITRIADNGCFDLKGDNIKDDVKRQANTNAMIVVRFFMMIEDLFNQVEMIIEEDAVDSLEELQAECIPFKEARIATTGALGLDQKSFQVGPDKKKTGAIPGSIKFDDRNTFTKIVIESVVLAKYFAVMKGIEEYIPIFVNGLRFIAASKYKRLSIIHGLGLLSKYIAYFYDFVYVDGVCGYFGLNLTEPTLPMNYPDLYGMIYEQQYGRYYSMSPRVRIDRNLSKRIWEYDDVNIFKRQHYDNNYNTIIFSDHKSKDKLITKQRFERLAKGYDLCATYIAALPRFIENGSTFEDIIHCVLKATIGYPTDFSKRNIYVERVGGKEKEFMKDFKRFRLENIQVQNLQTAKSASSVEQSDPESYKDNYFLLVSHDKKQYSYCHVSPPASYFQ